MRSFERGFEPEHILKLDTIPTGSYSYTNTLKGLMQTLPDISLAEACYHFYLSKNDTDLYDKSIITELESYVASFGFGKDSNLIQNIKEVVFQEAGRRFFNDTLRHEKYEGWKD